MNRLTFVRITALLNRAGLPRLCPTCHGWSSTTETLRKRHELFLLLSPTNGLRAERVRSRWDHTDLFPWRLIQCSSPTIAADIQTDKTGRVIQPTRYNSVGWTEKLIILCVVLVRC